MKREIHVGDFIMVQHENNSSFLSTTVRCYCEYNKFLVNKRIVRVNYSNLTIMKIFMTTGLVRVENQPIEYLGIGNN